MIRLFQGDNKGGLADYDKALQYDPLDVYSWNNRAQAKVGLGDKKDAIADFRKALELRPDHGRKAPAVCAASSGVRRKTPVDRPCAPVVAGLIFVQDIRPEAAGRSLVWSVVVAGCRRMPLFKGGLLCRTFASSVDIDRGKTGSACCSAC